MKKKNVLATLLVSAMLATMLVGCGSKEAEDTTATQTEVSTEAEVENPEDLPLQEVPVDETEAVEETETEEVAEADFFAENGLTVVAPADVTEFNARIQGTDEVQPLLCTVEMTDTSATTTEFLWTVEGETANTTQSGKFNFDWSIDIFDRVSGVSLTSSAYKTGDTATGESFAVPMADGTTMDCSYEFEMNEGDDYIMQVKMTLVHPEGYNNGVFEICGFGLKESAAPDYTNLADAISTGAVPADATFIAIQ